MRIEQIANGDDALVEFIRWLKFHEGDEVYEQWEAAVLSSNGDETAVTQPNALISALFTWAESGGVNWAMIDERWRERCAYVIKKGVYV